MDCALVRTDFRADGIFSELREPSGDLIAITLDHAYPDGLGAWVPKLVDGTYVCKRRLSPEFGYELFQIMDVPDCTYIEIHIGNFQSDSKGCVCLGMGLGKMGAQQMLTSSRAAFNKFMALQNGCDEFQLTVKSS